MAATGAEWRLAVRLDKRAVKVLDLQCDAAHSFEGWFGSEQDYQDQVAKGLVACPMCASTAIVKKLSAPRLNLKSASSGPEAGTATVASTLPASSINDASINTLKADAAVDVMSAASQELQARMLHAMREVISQTEDVGDQFASQARSMHYGESPPKAIRGQATPEQARELVEEGIDVMPLVVPEAFKKRLQ